MFIDLWFTNISSLSVPQIDITNIHIVPTVTGYYQVMLDISVDVSLIMCGINYPSLVVLIYKYCTVCG